MTRKSWDAYFLDVAAMVATRSTCPRAQVGAVLVLENRLVASGYNGSAAGQSHCLDVGCRLVDCPVHVSHCVAARHAEANAVEQFEWLADQMNYGRPYYVDQYVTPKLVMYATHQPCRRCDQRIREAGITSVIYASPYTGSLPGEGPCTLLAS